MAEEKNKKSIIALNDENTVSDQTKLCSILDKLSLGPNKKLLIISPHGILLHRVHKMNMRETPKNRSPDASCGPNLVYKRPFVVEFMRFCLERFEVGIWSSASERNVNMILDVVLEDMKDKFLFVWGQPMCTNSGLTTLENNGRPLFFKDISEVFQRFTCFSASNTIFIDDEPYKALLNPDTTCLFPLTYDPTDKNDDFLDPEGKFCSYLDDIANTLDVKSYIKEHSFGKVKIDSDHPDWSFYNKVLKMLL
ncbi:unnamed protein product [Cochlearia groenlandica]